MINSRRRMSRLAHSKAEFESMGMKSKSMAKRGIEKAQLQICLLSHQQKVVLYLAVAARLVRFLQSVLLVFFQMVIVGAAELPRS